MSTDEKKSLLLTYLLSITDGLTCFYSSTAQQYVGNKLYLNCRIYVNKTDMAVTMPLSRAYVQKSICVKTSVRHTYIHSRL